LVKRRHLVKHRENLSAGVKMIRRILCDGALFAIALLATIGSAQSGTPKRPLPPPQICIGSTCANSPASPGGKIKWNPGYYGESNTVVRAGGTISRVQQELDMVGAKPGIQGYLFLTTWGALEPTQGNYDFTLLDSIYKRLTTGYATPKRMALTVEVGGFTSTQPDNNDGSILPLYLQRNSVYGAAGTRVGGTTKNVPGAFGWWGGDGNGHTYAAQLHRASVMERYIALIKAIGAWGDSKPYFEAIVFAENSLWIGANNNNGSGSGYSDTDSTIQQQALIKAAVAAFPTTNVVYENTFMATPTPTQNLEAFLIANRAAPGQTDTLGLSYAQARGGWPGSWGMATVIGYPVKGSSYSGPDYRTQGVRTMIEVQAPDLGAFGGLAAARGGFAVADICAMANQIAQASHVFFVVIPDSVSWVPADRRWTQATATLAANPLIHTEYPSNYP
jgi:hypothetical protein